MSNSAINTQVAQLKIGNVQNQADNSGVYSAGVWSFKNSTAVTSVTITDAGAVTLGPSGFTGNHVVNGNVGIGTASKITGLESFTQFTVSGSNGGIAINSTNTAASDYSRLLFTKQGATGNEGVIRYNTNDYHMSFFTNALERMRIDASGNLLVGTTITPGTTNSTGLRKGSDGQFILVANSGGLFHQALNSYYTVTTSGGSTSDANLKKEVKVLSDCLDKVKKLRGVSFEFIEEPKDDANKGKQIGVIAQEVEAEFPEMVVTNDEGIKAVRYEKLVAPLIEAVKELSAKNEALEARLAALESKP